MSVIETEQQNHQVPAGHESRTTTRPHPPTGSASPVASRTLAIGLLGLGRVGQAVARVAVENSRLRDAGYRVRLAGALVRDVDKPRRCVRPSRLTTNPSAFLRGHYDVVLETLGEVEPACSLVRRLLGRGVPVVTANKALVAACGPELTALAAARGTTLRYEATALAGVPFLGALAARPLVSDVAHFTAVVNGTSAFVLSALGADADSCDAALDHARARGFTEPDSSRDLDGRDAADKLALLASVFGWGKVTPNRLEVAGIRDVTRDDLAAARQLGCRVQPVVFASRTAAGISAFVGPALVPASHPLASLTGALSGIHLAGRFVDDLFFSGPGAGPEITAATMLDDAIEAVSAGRPRSAVLRPSQRPARTAVIAPAPATPWFVRTTFPGLVPDAATTRELFASRQLTATHVTDCVGDTRWALIARTPKALLDGAIADLQATHRVRCLAMRALQEVVR